MWIIAIAFLIYLIFGIIINIIIRPDENKSKTEITGEAELTYKSNALDDIKRREEEFIETYKSIQHTEPKIYKEKTKRKYLKDIPNLNIKSVTKKTPLKDLENFVVLDVETTGLRPSLDEIVEISMIKFIENNPVECISTLVKPKKEIPDNISLINHIYNEDVENAPNIKYIIPDFNNFIKGFNIVGYNLIFDLQFLHCNGIDFFSENRKYYDCLFLARKYFKGVLSDFKLDTVASFCKIYRKNCHRATDDALATGIIFRDIGLKQKNSV